ncbi:SpoIIE family protein phosphatase, partial [Candidatus Gracilibacteria bacterium]|nr:SpoIIE family protein phosphatase [Candidatus Gracilibacteria bacterium]
DKDVIIGYTDGVLETKNSSGNMFGLSRLETSFLKNTKLYNNSEKIFEYIFEDLNVFKSNNDFEDDVSMFLFTRDFKKDVIFNTRELEQIIKDNSSKKSIKDIQIKNKTKQEIIEELKKEKYERELKIRLQRLDRLNKLGEYIKLKQEIILYYREGFIHDKMRKYLEKAVSSEQKFILKKQDDKLQRKYKMLQDLYGKGEYELVIKETLDIIFKNGKI